MSASVSERVIGSVQVYVIVLCACDQVGQHSDYADLQGYLNAVFVFFVESVLLYIS